MGRQRGLPLFSARKICRPFGAWEIDGKSHPHGLRHGLPAVTPTGVNVSAIRLSPKRLIADGKIFTALAKLLDINQRIRHGICVPNADFLRFNFCDRDSVACDSDDFNWRALFDECSVASDIERSAVEDGAA